MARSRVANSPISSIVPAMSPTSTYSPIRNGPQRQQHDAGRDVLQRALQRQSDGQADRADGGDDRRRLDAELAEHHDDDEDQHGIACDLGEEAAQASRRSP